MSYTATAPERFDFGGLRIDRAAHRAWVEGQEVALTALEFRLLMMLYDRRGRVLSRDLLLDEVWGSHADVTARNVDTHVKRVREKWEISMPLHNFSIRRSSWSEK